MLPLRSRDERPPILAGLQWIWTHPTLKTQIFRWLEQKVLAGKKATARTGMDLGPILVLGVVRLGLDANFHRLEHVANFDPLLRQILGVAQTPWGADAKEFNHQTLRHNLALLDDTVLKEINALIAATGREGSKKKKTVPLNLGHQGGHLRPGNRRPFPHRPQSALGRRAQVRGLD